MPAETIVVVSAVLAVFSFFAAVVIFADATSTRAPRVQSRHIDTKKH